MHRLAVRADLLKLRKSHQESCRVALGYNRLATLPMAFALLTHLRYLNLRANSFTVFPDVVRLLLNRLERVH